MKIQILYSDKNGGHCKVLDESRAQKLLDRLAKRNINATVRTLAGKEIGGAGSGMWGYASTKE